MDKQTQPHLVKKQQQRTLVIVGILAIIALLGIRYMVENHNPPPKPKDKIENIEFATPLNHVDAQSIWVERAQNQLAQENKKQDALKSQIDFLQQGKNTQDKTLQQQAEEIQALKNKLDNLSRQKTKSMQAQNSSYSGNLFPAMSSDANADQDQSDDFIDDDTLQLTKQKNPLDLIPSKNPNTFVPAGSFVRAVTLGGADAAAGVTSQADPVPMLYRILDQGTLPNHKKSHLKDCHIIAAVYGDISSKRGQVRLERLSCVRDKGEIIDIPIEGTVFGEDGKNGVRGNDYWGEGAFTERAFLAGTLSGISSGIAQSYTTNSLTPFGPVQTIDNGKILQYGLANGVGNAAEKLADYNIKRAEMFHPIVQLSAGTVVDIVFIKGFYLDGKEHNSNDQEFLTKSTASVDANSQTTTLENNSASTLPLTPQQIQILKQKNAQQGY